jgi:YggT family protein
MIPLIHGLLQIFILITIIDVVLSYVPDVRRQSWAQYVRRIADVPQKPLRELLPANLPLDPTPIIVIIFCRVLMALL